MTELARSFPELRGALVEPFDPSVLDTWAVSGVGHGASCAARFILSVWTGDTGASDFGKRKPSDRVWVWRARRFELHEALQCWDSAHRAAFLAWARDPWWP